MRIVGYPVAEIGEAVGPLVADLPQHGLEVVGHLRRVGLDSDVQARASRVVAEVDAYSTPPGLIS